MRDRDADQFNLRLDEVPFDEHAREVATYMDGTWQTTRTGEHLTLNLSDGNSGNIRKLAKAIRNVVGRGKSYLDPNRKWIADEQPSPWNGWPQHCHNPDECYPETTEFSS